MDADRSGFFGSAWQRLNGWREFLPFNRAARDSPGLVEDDVLALMQACLTGLGGETTARTRAAELGYLYLSLNAADKRRFLSLLAHGFDLNPETLADAAEAYLAEPTLQNYVALQEATQPPRITLLKRFNALPDGFTFLVDLRADLRGFLKEDPGLAALDADLQSLFEAWFDVGLLTFEAISWNSPAALLEKLVTFEAVHEIRSWQDLKNRLEADRRCYAFFHPKMPGVPLIFVEVALTQGVPGSVQKLLDESAPVLTPEDADTAVFYSISNTQRGLRGISFGSFLLKRVMEDLAQGLPNLKRFVTLSPIPGFRRWLLERWEEKGAALFSEAEWAALTRAVDKEGLEDALTSDAAKAKVDALLREDWTGQLESVSALQKPLLGLCAYYLVRARDARGRPLDPVARFHVTNGARVEGLNWLGNTAPNGLTESYGLMVNYLYEPGKLERYHEQFFQDGTVAASASLRRYAGNREKSLEPPVPALPQTL